MWLDEIAEVVLDESVPLVGAPEAWAAGFDGTGTRVAVLDTGVDDQHPDLAGKVVGAENFTRESDASDNNGHGTHVASTVAGTGAAEGGRYTGVAPGAATSSRGPRLGDDAIKPEITGPGVAIVAARAEGTSLGRPVNEFYTTLSGTSMATPHVAGAAAIALQAEPDLSPVELKATLAGTGTPTGRLGGTITSGPYQGARYPLSPGAGTAPISAPISGAPTFVGDACDPPAAGTGIALIERGPAANPCTFQEKLDNIVAAGYQVGIVFNQTGSGCLTEVLMDANGDIPFGFVNRLAGLQLLQVPDVNADNACTTVSPDPGAEVASTTIEPGALGSYTVYEQGGGLLNVPAALDSPVRATPATVDFGLFEFPHDDAEPAESDVTYTNRTDAPVTVELALDVTNPDGAAAPAEMLAVEPATLTVQPGGTASATVTVDVSAGGEFGVYGGYLIAEAGGAVATRTPVGFHKESEHYDLTVRGITRDGRPALGAASTFNVVDVTDTEAFRSTQNTFVNGSRTLRVPVGTYTVMGRLSTVDGSRSYAQSRTLAGDPEVEVTQDTTVVLDARKAVPLEIETPLHPDAVQAGNTGFAVYREGAENGERRPDPGRDDLPGGRQPAARPARRRRGHGAPAAGAAVAVPVRPGPRRTGPDPGAAALRRRRRRAGDRALPVPQLGPGPDHERGPAFLSAMDRDLDSRRRSDPDAARADRVSGGPPHPLQAGPVGGAAVPGPAGGARTSSTSRASSGR